MSLADRLFQKARHYETLAASYAQGECMSMLLDLERLGLASSYDPRSVLASRTVRREAWGCQRTTRGLRNCALTSGYS
jgi:hypothetical protein